eukprot:scaffold568_cov160-Amphora_coffeaeformis.AAC.6
MSCAFVGWNSITAALSSFFEHATAWSPEEQETAEHRQNIRRKLSLDDLGGSLLGGSLDTIGTNEGIMGDRSVWDFNFESPERIFQRSKENFYKNSKIPRSSKPPSSGVAGLCTGLDQCLGLEDEDEKEKPKREISSRSQKLEIPSWEEPPSFEGSEVSGYDKDGFKSKRPGSIVIYKPRNILEESQHFDVLWRRDCLDPTTRLVRWSGAMELSGPQTLSRQPNSNLTTISTGTSAISALVPESEVGWITCYSLHSGLTSEACAASKDPVLNHFCQRFGLWSNQVSSMDYGAIPASFDQPSLFHPYGSQAAEEELQRRLAMGEAPDGAVLNVAEVLQGMPIFFISDLFIQLELRGNGLGLVLLDRACQRIADSFCLVIVFLRDYTDERLPLYLGLLGFSFLAPGFLMRQRGNGETPPRLDEVCPFLPADLLSTSGGKL